LAFPESDSPLLLRTQIELIKSPIVLEAVVGHADVAQLPAIRMQSNPLEWLAKRVSIKSVGGSELYQIGVESPAPEIVPLLVNTVLDSYLSVQTTLTSNHSQRTIELLDQEMKQRTVQMNRMQSNLKELTRKVTGKDPSLMNFRDNNAIQSTLKPLESLNLRLASAEVEVQILEVEYKSLGELLDQKRLTLTPKEIDKLIEQDPRIVKLKSEIAQLEAKLLDEKRFGGMGEGHPSYQRSKLDLERATNGLRDMRDALASNAGEEFQQIRRREHEAELAQMRSQITSQKTLRDLLRAQLKQQQADLQALGDHSLEVDFARAELTREENVYQRIADRAVALRTELRAPGRVTVLKHVKPGDVYMSKSPLKYILGALLAGFCGPFALAVAWERQRRRIADAEHGQQESNLPVIAEIACLPRRATALNRQRSIKEERQLAMFEESINMLRIGLTMPEHMDNVRVLAVASAVAGEGKTSISSQLAASLGRILQKPVLLIDADLRSPSIHKLFDKKLDPGLCEVLEKQCTVQEAITSSGSEYLHILPAGRLRRNPHVLLTTQTFNALLNQVRASYEYIIIDSPPLLVASEAFVLAKAADGTVMCAMRDLSRGPQLRFACERLFAAGVRPLGLVLNGVPTGEYSSRYGGNYSYGTASF
jgi:capsular exopolysaccharide synthesis family protein